jgi:hypothetical protein
MLGRKVLSISTIRYVACGNDEVTYINSSTLLHSFEEKVRKEFVCKFVSESICVCVGS